MSDPSAPRLAIEPLRSDHELEAFDCGSDDLNRFLKRYALINQKAETARTYVACRGRRVVGYYSLAVGSVIHTEAAKRVTQGLARHPVPVMLLARLAVAARDAAIARVRPVIIALCTRQGSVETSRH